MTPERKDRILRAALYACGILALAVFVITKSETLMEEMTKHAYDDGDLYRFAKVRHFKVPTPAPTYYELPDVDPDSAAVFMIGDSFMDESRGYPPFVRLLSDSLDTAVYWAEVGGAPENFNLMQFFRSHRIKKGEKRTVILERVERYIVSDLSEFTSEEQDILNAGAVQGFGSWWEPIQERWFTHAEKNYEYFWTSSSITSPIVETWNTLLFDLLERMSDKTPVYSVSPPFLFYFEDTEWHSTTSFYYNHADSGVAAIADNLEMMRDSLASTYNAELVFMPVPNPYSLYHKFVSGDVYDNFLPRLCDEAEVRGIKVVRLYEPFAASSDILYFPTDSHWNERGMRLALRETLRVIGK